MPAMAIGQVSEETASSGILPIGLRRARVSRACRYGFVNLRSASADDPPTNICTLPFSPSRLKTLIPVSNIPVGKVMVTVDVAPRGNGNSLNLATVYLAAQPRRPDLHYICTTSSPARVLELFTSTLT